MNDRLGKLEGISEQINERLSRIEAGTTSLGEKVDSGLASVHEQIARVTSILAEMSVNTIEGLDRLQKGINKMPGKWELRLWVLILIAIIVILEFLVGG